MTAAILLSLLIVIIGCKCSRKFHPPVQFVFYKCVYLVAKRKKKGPLGWIGVLDTPAWTGMVAVQIGILSRVRTKKAS